MNKTEEFDYEHFLIAFGIVSFVGWVSYFANVVYTWFFCCIFTSFFIAILILYSIQLKKDRRLKNKNGTAKNT